MSDERKERPAYVRFERRPEEDRAETIAAGHMVMRDADYVVITPVGTKDEIPRKLTEWWPHLKQQVLEGRLPADFELHYKKVYEAWKTGQELPLDGTPLRAWPLISPAQLANCLAGNVRTVEDLAVINSEAAGRLGMGAQELRKQAEQWLRASKDAGVVVALNTSLRVENETLRQEVKRLTEQNQALAAENQVLKGGQKKAA